MTKVNLLTLFTTPQISNNAIHKADIRSFEFQTFNTQISPYGDNFTSNPLNISFKNNEEIEQIARNNNFIKMACKEVGIPIKANIDVLEKLKKGHLQNTRILAAKICSNLE